MRIGIDCGSLTVKGVLMDDNGNIIRKDYVIHEGEPIKAVRKILFTLIDGDDPSKMHIAITGTHANILAIKGGIEPTDHVSAEVAGANHLFGKVDHILHIGGASLMLISLDDKGNLLKLTTNSVCAAGTGSFLDEQSVRLGISHNDTNAIQPIESPPPIATRCAVFAKTDLIHRQQEGFSKQALWCGLCKGMSNTAIQTLLKGREINGVIALTGGVMANPSMVHYLKDALKKNVVVSEYSPLCGAIGATIVGERYPLLSVLYRLTASDDKPYETEKSIKKSRPPLLLKHSSRPTFSAIKEWKDQYENEIRLHIESGVGQTLTGFMGIDIGSTSTKAVIIGSDNKILLDVYRRTEGDPVSACKKLMAGVKEAEEKAQVRFDIQGLGTTGSGRRIAGMILGADVIVNEITAHVKGAVMVDPSVTTIFEIGGQDSKYMRIKDGKIVDANMNYVCAAGTGTFVEELGRKLGFTLDEIGEKSLGCAPAYTSDRCTVFMEQDAHNLAREGASKQEIMAAILYSVIENYKSKVVGNRWVDKKRIVFQGATARNIGLVAAIENIFNVEVVVSPFCHVMGAIGAGLLAKEKVMEGRTRFRGMDLLSRRVEVKTTLCDLCSNRCVISSAHIEGLDETPSFGYLCGREPTDTKMKKNEYFQPFRARRAIMNRYIADVRKDGNKPKIGIPFSLASWGYAPLFAKLIENLGAIPVFSRETDRNISSLGTSKVASDFCFPVKVAHGHVASLLAREDLDGIFVPVMVEAQRNPYTTRSRFCPYLNAYASLVAHLFDENPIAPLLISPVIDFNMTPKEMGNRIAVAFAGVLDISPEDAGIAFQLACDFQKNFEKEVLEEGKRHLSELKKQGKRGIVIIGRPYNTLDPTVSMRIPATVSESSFTVIPMDMLPFQPEKLDAGLHNMYWNYGQRILSAVKQVANDPDLFGIYLTSFNCGPDSFILSFAEHIMGDKPFLILEMDEHGSDGGYTTRIEAFLDVVKNSSNKYWTPGVLKKFECTPEELKGRILWVPPIHPVNTRLFCAVLRAHGIDARALPPTDEQAFALGKAETRGSECTPMALTLGVLIKTIKESGLPPDKHALFMPTATGPCRFGSYALGQHLSLERMGLGSIPIFSPSSENSYYGIPTEARKKVWDAILCGDILYKMRLYAKAHERKNGDADSFLDKWIDRFEMIFENRLDPIPYLERAGSEMKGMTKPIDDKPLVGVVGEIYVRCDPFANSFVIDAIENNGGEAWLSPFSEWILYTVWAEQNLSKIRGLSLFDRLLSGFANAFIEKREHECLEAVRPYLYDRMEPPIDLIIEEGLKYIPKEFEGESVLTIGRAIRFLKEGAEFVVNVAPFGCMHGHISGAIFEKISQEFGKPIITSFYDAGTTNKMLRSFLLAAQNKGMVSKSYESGR